MHTPRHALLLALCCCSLAAASTPTSAAADCTTMRCVVELWTPADVELWVNRTLGYPEYAEHFRAGLVDGATLLVLSVDDVQDSMPITNRLHLAKIDAHLQLLKGRCLCARDVEPAEFWAQLRLHPRRFWVFGAAVIYAPRAALLGAYFLDTELYESFVYSTVSAFAEGGDVVGGGGEEAATTTADGVPRPRSRSAQRVGLEYSLVLAVAYWLLGLVCPSTYLLLNGLPFVTSNPAVAILVSATLVVSQHAEVEAARSVLSGRFRQMPRLDKLFLLLPLPTIVPVLAVVASYILPTVVLQLLVFAQMVLSLVTLIGFVLVMREVSVGAAEETAETAESKEK